MSAERLFEQEFDRRKEFLCWTVANTAVGAGSDLSSENLNEADLSNANLADANLSRASLIRTNLQRANLKRSNLSGANLFRSILHGADLTEANMAGADLSMSNLDGANLNGANLEDADLRGAIGNNREILTLQTGILYVVICAPTQIAAIGNEQRSIAQWLDLADKGSSEMDAAARYFWDRHQWIRPLFEQYS